MNTLKRIFLTWGLVLLFVLSISLGPTAILGGSKALLIELAQVMTWVVVSVSIFLEGVIALYSKS